MKLRKQNPEKAAKLEQKGDALISKGKIKRAVKKFRKAVEYDTSRTDIYEKLLKAREQLGDEWKVADFVESVDFVMQQQEKENPEMRHLHVKLSPEFENAKMVVMQIIATKDQSEAESLTKKLCALGETGTRAAIDAIFEIKRPAEKLEDTGDGA